MKKNIVLSGFMGCGKTSIGKYLAEKLDMNFVDTDQMIEKNSNTSIKSIFNEFGEDYFRNIEHETCCNVSSLENAIICTGGGALTFERNFNALKDNSVIFFIKTDFDEIMNRLKNDTTRPLLDKENIQKNLDLYNKRIPLYEKHSHIIINGNDTIEKVSDEIRLMFKFEMLLPDHE